MTTTAEVGTLIVRIPVAFKSRGGRKLIITPVGAAAPTGPVESTAVDVTLVKTLVKAHRRRRRIETGKAKSITDLAEQENVTVAYVTRLLPPPLMPAPWPVGQSHASKRPGVVGRAAAAVGISGGAVIVNHGIPLCSWVVPSPGHSATFSLHRSTSCIFSQNRKGRHHCGRPC